MRIKLMQHTQRFTLTGAHQILRHSKNPICKDKNLYKTNTPQSEGLRSVKTDLSSIKNSGNVIERKFRGTKSPEIFRPI